MDIAKQMVGLYALRHHYITLDFMDFFTNWNSGDGEMVGGARVRVSSVRCERDSIGSNRQ